MASNPTLMRAVKLALVVAGTYGATAIAQEAELEQVVVTGTRITLPGIESSSPIVSVGAEEIRLQQKNEVEQILRVLPVTLPADGGNVNNGTAGVATVNLRGLGTQRNLILMDGKRLTPYNYNGLVDTSIIPTALIERLDIITGGASAVYGSDAISGALNFIMKKDFEGVEVGADYSLTEKGDGDITTVFATLGSNVADGRGNVVLGINWSERDAVLLGSRPLGRLGIETSTGAGYDEFRAGQGPVASTGTCAAPGAVVAGGSTTTMPTRVAISGGPGLGQFRNDGTLGSNCSVFNFNPFNYYQTPQEKFNALTMGSFEINEHAEAYARAMYTKTKVRQQVAPSGIFGSSFFTPLANPFISDQALGVILNAANTGRLAGTVGENNWRDLNENGVVDEADDLRIQYRRRTLEFGERSTTYNNDQFQLMFGFRGNITGDWDYDLSYQYGGSDRSNVSAGYTNIANVEAALQSTDGVTCANGQSSCVPINLFGGFGSITPAMARYSSAVAIDNQSYEQMIISGSVNGQLGSLPWVDDPIGVSFGAEYREESAETVPDECWKLEPTSCLGGAGGTILPRKGGFNVNEYFVEAIVPLLSDVPFVQSFDLELGYRWSDYSKTGSDETYKYGFSWRPFDQLLVRAMQQRAARAPNVGELASPRVSGLDNAALDPCSVANSNITAQLQALCISTGMTAAQVGTVENIVAGQINSFTGTDVDNLPDPEKADTTTVGLVWTPSFGGDLFRNWIFSVDYYDIEVEDYIGEFSAQEVLDGCYVLGQASQCDKIVRVFGTLTEDGSGVETLTTNLDYINAEGVEFGFQFNVGLPLGDLTVSGNWNHYLTQESQSSKTTPVLDCLGFYGTSCGNPLPENRWIQRTTWSVGMFDFSYLWRHLDSVDIEQVQVDSENGVFPAFQSIDSYDYFDLYASVNLFENTTLSLGVVNVTDEDPPVVGNEAGTTAANSGNTFPSVYDTLGRVFTAGVKVRF